MNLLQAFHATKVLVLACALAMPVGLPAAGQDFPNVQTRVRHISFKDRAPSHAWHKRHGGRFSANHKRHRSVMTSVDRLPPIASADFSRVETRTRHIRLKDRRHPFGRRHREARPRIIIIVGGYAPTFGNYDGPSVIPGLGTYAGNLSAYAEEGNGIYFRRNRSYRYVAENDFHGDAPMKRAKIIFVTPKTNASACSFEAGVCVIRP